MTAATVNFVALALGINTVAGTMRLTLLKTTAAQPSPAPVPVLKRPQPDAGELQRAEQRQLSAPQVTGGAAAQPRWGQVTKYHAQLGATNTVISTRASVGPQNLTESQLLRGCVAACRLCHQWPAQCAAVLQDSSGRTAAITQRAASSLTGNSWNLSPK